MNTPLAAFDLDAYAARYRERGKIQRLRFIADHSPELRVDALRLAVSEAKKGCDTFIYKDIFKQADGALEGDTTLDEEWIARTDRWAGTELEKLRHELEENKQQANKEVIRTGHNDLGDFFHKRGRLSQARGDYIKTRDYCSHAQHNLQMCLKVITVSIEAGDFGHIENHYMMAANIPDVDKDCPELAKMRACAGLASLVRGNYAAATRRFLGTNGDASEEKISNLQREFGDIMSLEDVAIYGGLCALATLDRQALTKQVIDKLEFRNLLELVPDVREIIYDFYNSRYTRCLTTMAKIRPDLMMDMNLGRENHVDNLFRLIQRKAIVQYVSPFTSAKLGRMQAVFGTTAEELENELLDLIHIGAINARIDKQHNALHAKKSNARLEAITLSLQKGQEAFEDAEAMLLRMTLMKNDVQISSASLSRSASEMGPRGRSFISVADNVFDRPIRHS